MTLTSLLPLRSAFGGRQTTSRPRRLLTQITPSRIPKRAYASGSCKTLEKAVFVEDMPELKLKSNPRSWTHSSLLPTSRSSSSIQGESPSRSVSQSLSMTFTFLSKAVMQINRPPKRASPSLDDSLNDTDWDYMPTLPQDEEDVELSVSVKGGNWGNKLHEGAQWIRRGKLAAWTPARDDWEIEERARKRIKRMLPSPARSPSPPRFPHLRSPSPPLVAPYPPPVTQHLSFTSFVLDPAAQHSFRSGMLTDLERATCGLIEGEAALRRAMGRLWEILSDDSDTRTKLQAENRRSATIPKKEDIDGEDGFSDREEESVDSEHLSTAPEMASNLHRIFINTHQDGIAPHLDRILPAIYEPTATMVAQQQEEALEKGLATLRELQEDGREYVERLEEIREGLGWVRSQKQGLWTVIRERALKEMEEGEML